MQIIENIISKEWQEDILKYVYNLPFMYTPGTSYQQHLNGEPLSFVHGLDYFIDENTTDTAQFVHSSLFSGVVSPDQSISYSEFRPFLYMVQENIKRKIKLVTRVKVNCVLQNTNFKDTNYNIAHVDTSTINKNTFSAIYYVNDSDGDTFFFNEHCKEDSLIEKLTIKERITPKMGTMVIFPSNQFHASSNPIKSKSRFVVNFMFEMED